MRLLIYLVIVMMIVRYVRNIVERAKAREEAQGKGPPKPVGPLADWEPEEGETPELVQWEQPEESPQPRISRPAQASRVRQMPRLSPKPRSVPEPAFPRRASPADQTGAAEVPAHPFLQKIDSTQDLQDVWLATEVFGRPKALRRSKDPRG